MKKSTLLLLVLCMLTIQLSAQHKNPEKEKESARLATEPSTISLEKLITQKNDTYVVIKQHISSISGIHHIYLRQAINGLEVYGTESGVHIDKTGKVLMEHNKFLADVQATLKNSSQGISARQAITSVAGQMNYKISSLQEIKSIGNKNKAAVFNKAGISSEDIPVKLMYYYREGYGTQLVWELSVAETTSSDWWNFRVDASNGKIIDKDNWTISCNIFGNHEDHLHAEEGTAPFVGPMEEPIKNSTTHAFNMAAPPVASYRVYAMPIESPNFGTRTLVTNPENLTASPYGWHDTNGDDTPEYTNTRGNNVDAYDDDNANNNPDGKYAFSPGGNLIFDFPLNTTYSAGDQSENAAVTNLFYWSNIIHDVTYQYGFDEASGNFQQNNYGNGGAGNDPVNAEAQDGSGTCNANFSTPGDGSRPRMQMYVCNTRDGDLDNMVIVHEYGHGISNRLSSLGGQEQMGEGWSDYYGLLLTMKSGDAGPDSRGVGTWLIGEGAGGPGIRVYPYSTNFGVNPHTYDAIKTAVAPHGVGSVWAEMLWEMTWELIAIHGFDSDIYNGTGGNNISLALVTEGLKLQTSQPGFVDGRDAILAADMAMYGGANQCAIWDAFARRGLGYSAIQGTSSSKTDGTEAFDLPPTFSGLDVIDEVCLSDGIQTGLAGGNPAGGVYSGPGVTDNGGTFTFDPSVGGPGLVTVTYVVNDFCTGAPTTLTDDINVTNDPPEIVCMGSGLIPMSDSSSISPATPILSNTTITSTITVTDNVSITDLDIDLNINHTWVGDLVITLESPAGTVITILDPGSCSGDDVVILLDDEAPTTSTACYGTGTNQAYPDSSYQPFAPLSAFDGEVTLGDWILSVSDTAGGDNGTLNSWGLNYSYEVTAPVLDVTLDGSGNATINAEDLLFSVFVDCGGYTVLAGSPLATTVSFTCSDTGLNTIDVEVTNDNGAVSTCSAIVNVIGDGGGGPLVCPGDIIQDNDTGICGAIVTYTIESPTGCGGGSGSQTFSYTGALENWTVPTGVTSVTIEARGAEGGNNVSSSVSSGKGAVMKGDFSVTPGSSLKILVGENNTAGNGGGGGTFVTDAANAPIIIAGGGGGSAGVVDSPNKHGQIVSTGGTGAGGGGTGGSAGNGGNVGASFASGAGGGLLTDGADGWTSESGGKAFINGGAGADVGFGIGGFGGGGNGSGDQVGGGGGGYSGGGSGSNSTGAGVGGGGGSFNGGSNQINTTGDATGNSGNGLVTITWAVATGTLTQTAGLPSGDTFPVGTTTNTFEYDDGINPVQTCSFDVTINDTEDPVITCPGNITQDNDPGICGAIVTYTEPTVTDNCGSSGTMINTMPNQTSAFSGSSRGYWFTAPEDFTITSLRVPTLASIDNQSIMVMSFAASPEDYPNTSSYDALLFYTQLNPDSGFLAVNIPITAGQVIGILGVRGNINSYTNDATINIGGNPLAINRFGTQNDISAGPAPQGSFWSESASQIKSNVDFEYVLGSSTVSIIQTAGLASGSTFPVGTTTNTFVATDAAGNTDTCSFDVIINDTETPVITCVPNATRDTDAGVCGYTVQGTEFDATFTDNCTSGSITNDFNGTTTLAGDVLPVGGTTVVWTVDDGNGQTDSCTTIITVIDNEAPLAVCQNITVQLDASGNITITGADVDGGSTDNCGIASMSVSPSSFGCADVGDNNVILTVTDLQGNSNTCTAIVTVEDVTAPLAVCQNITVELDPVTGTVTISSADVDGGSTDACGIDTYSLDIDTFDCSNIGDNTVILTVTDVNGNESTCTAIVTVEDNVGPILVCQDFTLELGPDGTAMLDPNDVIASNTDNCGIATIAVDINEFSCADIGTPVTVQVFTSDLGGNLSTCTAVVTVVDLLAPVLTCPADQTVDPGAGNLFYIVPDYLATGAATAIDNCTDPVTITTQDPAAGTPLSDGVYTITLTATDEYGNTSTCEFELTVESILGVGDNNANIGSVQMYPNPAKHTVMIGNPANLSLENLQIFDIRGRMIKTIDLRNMGAEKAIDVSEMAAATYLVLIQGENGQITKRLIKE